MTSEYIYAAAALDPEVYASPLFDDVDALIDHAFNPDPEYRAVTAAALANPRMPRWVLSDVIQLADEWGDDRHLVALANPACPASVQIMHRDGGTEAEQAAAKTGMIAKLITPTPEPCQKCIGDEEYTAHA